MKITVLTGSPHRDGTTALLAERLLKGRRRQAIRRIVLTPPKKKYFPVLPATSAGRAVSPASLTTICRNCSPICLGRIW